MGIPVAIGRLAAIAQHLAEADHPLAEWLTESVAFARSGAPLEAAFDLGHGYDVVCRHDAQRRALAALLPGTVNAKAAVIAAAIQRRSRGATAPQGIDAQLDSYVRAGGPSSARSIRRRLAEL